MYIKNIQVQGFRNFHDTNIDFSEGVNVIIGHNNAGKTNLLKALSLVLDSRNSRNLEVDDFNKHIPLVDLKTYPPKIVVTLTIGESTDEDLTGDDLVTVAPWLVQLQSPYTAMLTYEFFLPEAEHESYKEILAAQTERKTAWLAIKHEFLRKYVHKVYGGKPELKAVADNEALQKFDYQFLNAIRDVERDMLTGRNSLLKDVIDFFMDYEIKIDTAKDKIAKVTEIKSNKLAFSKDAQQLIETLRSRMEKGREHIMKYASDTGASFNDATPQFDGHLSEFELYSALRLIISYSTGIEIPATHNGLGYNNLIYMSLLLAKMQVDTNGDYLGSNAKVFPVLVIEEPEAHLHPSLQYKFLKFLHGNNNQKARQIFITTHSTNITAAVSLDQIISIHASPSGQINIGYPGKVFGADKAGKKSKNYVQRFLDATRSDMLFSKNVILVEGIAEQLLIPTFARYLNKSLEDTHTVVVHVGGRYFEHFLKLFDTRKPNTIHKQVACITDRDPTRKKIAPNAKSEKCYPFEVGQEPTIYEYSNSANTNLTLYTAHPNIAFFSQDEKFGKTLEYEMMLENPGCELLITDDTSNTTEFEQLAKLLLDKKTFSEVIETNITHAGEETTRIIESLKSCKGAEWDDASKIKALISSRYLNSVGKGGNALEVSYALDANLTSASKIPFNVPSYIKAAIEWACQ
nr:AAA family ATPase [uncultured Dyadobacter sp.]